MSLLAHILTLSAIIDAITHALHIRLGVKHLNVDASGGHRAWIETRHWMIAIRWKG